MITTGVAVPAKLNADRLSISKTLGDKNRFIISKPVSKGISIGSIGPTKFSFRKTTNINKKYASSYQVFAQSFEPKTTSTKQNIRMPKFKPSRRDFIQNLTLSMTTFGLAFAKPAVSKMTATDPTIPDMFIADNKSENR